MGTNEIPLSETSALKHSTSVGSFAVLVFLPSLVFSFCSFSEDWKLIPNPPKTNKMGKRKGEIEQLLPCSNNKQQYYVVHNKVSHILRWLSFGGCSSRECVTSSTKSLINKVHTKKCEKHKICWTEEVVGIGSLDYVVLVSVFVLV